MEIILESIAVEIGGFDFTLEVYYTTTDPRLRMRFMNDSAQEVWPGGLQTPPWV